MTDFALSEMRREASTHFRPECVQVEDDSRVAEPQAKKTKKEKKEKTKQKDSERPSGEHQDGGSDPPSKKAKKEKKKKNEEEEGDSEASSLPW